MLESADLRGIVSDLTQEPQFQERNEWISWARDMINQQREVSIPGLEDLALSYHSPKLRKDAHSYVNKLVAAPIRIEVAAQVRPGGSETEIAEKRAQRVENLYYRLWARWKASGVIARAVFDMVALRRGHVHLFLNRDILPIVPQPEDGETPTDYTKRAKPILDEFQSGERANLFELEHVAPETVYWTPDRSHKAIAARVPLNPLAKQYARGGAGGYLGEAGKGKGISVNKQGEIAVTTVDGTDVQGSDNDWNRKVTLYIIESAEYCYHYLFDGYADGKDWKSGKEGHLIGCYKNVFGTPGIFDFNGELTGQDHALHGTSALIHGLYETESLVNAFGKLILSGGIEAAQQQRTLIPAAGEGAAREREDHQSEVPQVRLLNEKWRMIPPGYDVSAYTDTLPADVLNAFNAVLQERENYGFPKVLGQPEELDATSGYDRAKATDAVSSQLDPPLERIANAVGEVFTAVASGVKEIGIDVPVRNLHPTSKLGKVPRSVQEEITVSAEDIQDADLSVKFDSKTQYSRIAEVEESMKLMQLDLISETMVMTDVLGYDDPERVRLEIQQDKMRKIADEAAMQDAMALFKKLKPIVEGEAIEEEGLTPAVTVARAQADAEAQQAAEQAATAGAPMNGAASAVMQPMTPPEPNPMAELGLTGQM